MARTKRVTGKPAVVKTNNIAKTEELILKKLKEEEQRIMEILDKQLQEELQQVTMAFAALRTKFPPKMLERTMAEIKNGEVDDSAFSTTVLSDLTNTFNLTKSVSNTTKSSRNDTTRNLRNSTVSTSDSSDANKTKVPRSHAKRSISVGCDDEGYTTAESSRATNSGGSLRTTRMSRSKTRIQPQQTSRSLSRTATKNLNAYITPANKQPRPNTTGTITPKCKPNTPLLYVRRPKVGEMAWSNQGSPLLVSGTVAPEHTANVNIPMGDDILSMLPNRGVVRESQIPNVDEDTRLQLEILRDNLIKVCQTIKK